MHRASGAVEKHDIYRKVHADGVNGFLAVQEQSFTRLQRSMSQQAAQPRPRAGSDIAVFDQHGVTRTVHRAEAVTVQVQCSCS